MKEGIHPKYEPTTIKCACGEVIEIPGSVAEEGEMDCPACGEHLEFDFDEDEDEEEKDEE